MARPREFDQDEAVEAALMRLWRNGYASTSINDLAECMGISRSSFYNSFGDRESVFLAALSEYMKHSPDAKFFAIGKKEPVLPAMRDIIHEICVERSDPKLPKGCFAVNSFAEFGENESKLADVMKSMVARKIDVVTRLYQQAKKQDELPANTNTKLLADETVVFLCGLNLVAHVFQDYDRLWAMARDFMVRIGFPPDVVAGKSK